MTLKRAAINLSTINGFRFFLGFLFQILLARHFGISKELDCLFIALTIFNFAGMAHLFLTSLFIPVFNEIRQIDEKEGFVFADVVIKWSAGAALAIAVILGISGDFVIKLVASGFDQERAALTVTLTRVLLLALVFHSISITIIYILNALYHFALPAITGLFHPLFNITFLFSLTPKYGIEAIAFASLAANTFQACILIAILKVNTRWAPTFRIYHKKIPELINKSSKMAFSGFIWDLREIISRNVASQFPTGSVALLAYAEKFIIILFNLTVNPVSRVFYSKISSWLTNNNFEKVRQLFNRTLMANVVLITFAGSGLLIFLPFFLNLIFAESKFSAMDIRILSSLVAVMLVYLLALCGSEYFTRLVYALKNTKIVATTAILGTSVFFITANFLSGIFGIYGIAISFSLTQLFVLMLYYRLTRNTLQIDLKKHAVGFGKLIAVSILVTGLGFSGRFFIQDSLYQVAFILPIWSFIYLVALNRVLKPQELGILDIRRVLKG